MPSAQRRGERLRVVVVGGGLAGLSAALYCADAGASVVLLERRHRLGGATWSFKRNGVWYDNGQHVFMRCCTAYQSFLRRIGSEDGVYLQPRLEVPVLQPGGRVGVISRSDARAPFHLMTSLLTYPHLSLPERLLVVRTALALRRLDPGDPALDRMSFGDWLAGRGEGHRSVETFWDLIVLPTVNLPAAEASLKLAAKVFVTGLLSAPPAADIGWAKLPLGELHAAAAKRAFKASGVEVHTRAAVEAVLPGEDGRPVVLAEGQNWEADAVVVAVPHDQVASLLPEGSLPDRGRPEDLGHSPIVNVNLVYDRPVTELRMAAAIGSELQFVFDRTEAAGLDDGRQCLAVSLSAADAYVGVPSAELVSRFRAEIVRLFPSAGVARVTESVVTRAQTATFAGTPGSDRLRLSPKSGLAGVFLAGAWCDTGWPATMEGAVRSGVSAARLALASS